MANKNTKNARKRGLTNMETTTMGTGVSRQIVPRDAAKVFKGSPCNTRRPAGKDKWVGMKNAANRLGKGKGGEN